MNYDEIKNFLSKFENLAKSDPLCDVDRVSETMVSASLDKRIHVNIYRQFISTTKTKEGVIIESFLYHEELDGRPYNWFYIASCEEVFMSDKTPSWLIKFLLFNMIYLSDKTTVIEG